MKIVGTYGVAEGGLKNEEITAMVEGITIIREMEVEPERTMKEALKEKEAILAWEKYQAGDFVSMEQFVVKTPGRQLEGYGREEINNNTMVVLFLMAQQLVLFGLRIRYLLAQEKQYLPKSPLSSGSTRKLWWK